MLKQFFTPESVALVGASRSTDKLGYRILKNLLDGGYGGTIYPVNPSAADKILGLDTYASVADIPAVPELAVIVIPSKHVIRVARECGEKGVKGLVVISAGFKEAGEEGRQREDELKRIVSHYGMRMVGPNCLGVIDAVSGLNASFAFEMPPRGKISFITQSGALGTAVLDWAAKENIGLSKFVSFGNMADVSGADLVEEFGDDPETNVILLYLEGLQEGRRFIEKAKAVSARKPVVIVKSGRSAAGTRAVSSHTGSLAGSDSAYGAAFSQAGVIRADSVQELFDYATVFAYQPMIKGKNIAIVTNAGGPAVMAIDAIESGGLEPAELSGSTKSRLRKLLPPAASVGNPVDVLGDALADAYGKALELLLSEGSVDAVIAILSPQVVTQIPETAEAVVAVARRYKKPVVACFMGGKKIREGADILMKNGIPNYPFPERAVSAVKGMLRYKQWVEKNKGNVKVIQGNRDKVSGMIRSIRESGGRTAGDVEGRAILASYGIEAVKSMFAATAEECVQHFKNIGGPVVMKLVSPDILHKTEAGGVKVNLSSPAEVEKGFHDITEAAKRYKNDASVEGVQLQPFVKGGMEVIVGVSRDVQFGHLLMFGLGGIYVELLKDVAFRVMPVTDVDVREMIGEIRTAAMLKGFRGTPERDIEALADVMLKISGLCHDFPEIEEMDINPLMVMEKGRGAIAVDARFAFDF